jgi:hypothetical protein
MDRMAARAAILALINTLPRLYRTTRRTAVEGRWRAFWGRSPLEAARRPRASGAALRAASGKLINGRPGRQEPL